MRQGKLGRTASARRALFRSSVTNLFIHDRIITTESKAKEMRPIAEKLITWARKGDLHHRRLRHTFWSRALQRLFDEIGPIQRPGDILAGETLPGGNAAPLAVIELVGRGVGEKKAKAKK